MNRGNMKNFRLILTAATLSVTLAACSSTSTSGAGEALEAEVSQEAAATGPDVAKAVSIAYGAMGLSLQEFLSTPVDESDLEGSAVASAAKLPQIRKDYDYFHLVINAITSDEELGTNGAPSLAMLQSVDSAMGQWIAVRESYTGKLATCIGAGDINAFIDCQEPIFAQYETQLVDTAEAAGIAFQEVDNAGN